MKKGFWGGVHPPARKELTQAASPRIIPMPRELIFPLAAGGGAPQAPAVHIGDVVCIGQPLSLEEGESTPLHASVSGRVVAIEARSHPKGMQVHSIVIENDHQYTKAPSIKRRPDAAALSPSAIYSIIRAAGIAGTGGAVFALERPIDTLLINACECEPYVTADDSLLCYYTEQVVLGIELIAKLLRPTHIRIAIEDNKLAAAAALHTHVKDTPIAIHVLPTRYPQGAKEQLIQAVTGKQIPPGSTAADVGCAVYNVATCASVYKAVYAGEPIIKRIVTVTGGAIKKPENFIAPIGTPLSHLIEAAGGFVRAPHKIIAGGPMMGVAQAVLDAPLVRSINAVICLGDEDRVKQVHPVCMRCGKCLAACPMHLQPLYAYRYERTGKPYKLPPLHLEDCLECGCCAYVCPGKLPLVEIIRRCKQTLGIAAREVRP